MWSLERCIKFATRMDAISQGSFYRFHNWHKRLTPADRAKWEDDFVACYNSLTRIASRAAL